MTIEVVDPGVGNDLYPNIQQAIDDAIAASPQDAKVKIPFNGVYTLSQTIDMNPPRNLQHLTLEGPANGIPYIAGAAGLELQPLFADRPMLAIQAMRGVEVSGIRFQGPTQTPADLYAEAAWDALYSTELNQQFCGVAVDPWSGDPPPAPNYSPVNGWTFNDTSMVTIRNCQFRFLGVGIGTKLSGGDGSDQQADFCHFSECNIQWCKWALSINGSQTRANTLRDVEIWDCWAGIGSGYHGIERAGPIHSIGSTFDRVAYIVRAKQAGFSNIISIVHSEGEGVGSCAHIEGGNSTTKFVFNGNSIRFYDGADQSTVDPNHFTVEGCQASVQNNVFRVDQAQPRATVSMKISGGPLSIGDNLVRPVNENPDIPSYIVTDASGVPGMFPWRIDQNGLTNHTSELWPDANGQLQLLASPTDQGNNQYEGIYPLGFFSSLPVGSLIATQSFTSDPVYLFKLISMNTGNQTAVLESLNVSVLSSDSATILGVLQDAARYAYLIDYEGPGLVGGSMDKNVAGQFISFQANLLADGTPALGLVQNTSVDVYVSVDGAAQALGLGTLKDQGNGEYQYLIPQPETNGDHVAFVLQGATIIGQTLNAYPEVISDYQADVSGLATAAEMAKVIKSGEEARHVQQSSVSSTDVNATVTRV